MRNRIVLAVVGVVAVGLIAPVWSAAQERQPAGKLDAESLLKELGAKLRTIPDTKDQCQKLLKEIAAWQEKKLKELEGSKPKGGVKPTDLEASKLKGSLQVTGPKEGEQVPERPTVAGTVDDANAKIWLVIHPTEVSDYWVGPSASVKPDGSWKAVPYIGRPGPIDVGKHFEIRAVANPKEEIKEGVVLAGWPEAERSSQVIEVTRK